MPEDKLTKYERLRLECFSQAINSSFTIMLKEGQQRNPEGWCRKFKKK